MKNLIFLLLASSILWSIPAKAQKNAQGKVLYAIMEELSATNGPESIEIVRLIKTKVEVVNYFRMKAKRCPNCPILQEFVKGLSVAAQKPKGIPKTGTTIADQIHDEVKKNNFGARLWAYYEFNIYGVDDSQTQRTKCEPFFGLNRWGCPIPCHGFCPNDPIQVPPGIADESYSNEDSDYGTDGDYDYEYDDGAEEEFNYDDYEPNFESSGEYEYDPD